MIPQCAEALEWVIEQDVKAAKEKADAREPLSKDPGWTITGVFAALVAVIVAAIAALPVIREWFP
jgi:hypothetical protein